MRGTLCTIDAVVEKLLSIKTWKAVLILSLVVPIGLVVSFRAANVTHGPLAISETVILDPIRWQHEMLDSKINLMETIEGHYSSDIVVNQSILVAVFEAQNPRYDGWDDVQLSLNCAASVDEGFVESVHLSLKDDYEYGRMHLGWPDLIKTENLSMTNYRALAQEVFADLQGVGQPRNASFNSLWADWAFYSPYNQTHEAEAYFEITYYNGTAYKEVVQPFLLRLVPDSNMRDTAVKITPGIKYSGLFLGGDNYADFYKIGLVQGQSVRVEVNDTGYPLYGPDFYMVVYDPAGNVVIPGNSNQTYFFHEVDFNANATGDWYIEVHKFVSSGFYTLEVDIQ